MRVPLRQKKANSPFRFAGNSACRQIVPLLFLVLTAFLLAVTTFQSQNNLKAFCFMEEETQGSAKNTEDPKAAYPFIDCFHEIIADSPIPTLRNSHPPGLSRFFQVSGYVRQMVKPPEALS